MRDNSMKKISIIFTVLIFALLSMLTACGQQVDEPASSDGASTNAISSVNVNGKECRVDAVKNPGGQETGMLFSISIPKAAVQDETNVTLTLELGSGWSISEDSNCIVQMDGSNVIVDLSEEAPVIVLKADAMDKTRCYHLAVE